jgi:hypothetical protein
VSLYPFIEAEKSQGRNVKRTCELFKVSRAAYYAARREQPSKRAQEDAELARKIQAAHQRSKGRYGAPRVHAQLRAEGKRHSPQADRPADAPGRPAGPGREALEEDHHPGPGRRRAGGPGSGVTSPPTPRRPTPAGAATSPTFTPGKAGSTWQPSSISPPAGSSATPSRTTCAPS